MSWFEVAMCPTSQFSSIFNEIVFFTYADSDRILVDTAMKHANKEKREYLKNLYATHIGEYTDNDENNEKLKKLLSVLNLKISIEDTTLKQIAETAFPNCYEIVSAKCSNCEACRFNEPGQLHHMREGGCLEEK